jgi:branched-chain amino acid transport system substrate-binding protein
MDDKTREWSKRFLQRATNFNQHRYFAKHNSMPTMWQAGVYSSVVHYLKAVEMAGTDEPLKVGERMRALPVEDFFREMGNCAPMA